MRALKVSPLIDLSFCKLCVKILHKTRTVFFFTMALQDTQIRNFKQSIHQVIPNIDINISKQVCPFFDSRSPQPFLRYAIFLCAAIKHDELPR